MKKPVKRSLIALAIIAGILILISAGLFLRFYLGTRNMKPAETSIVNDSVSCIKDRFVNAFLFKGENGYLMVDAGNSEQTVQAELEKLGINPDQVNTLLLTHTDGDHIGAVGLFKNIRIYMDKEEEQMINGKNGKFFFLRTIWKYGPYILLNDNDTLTLNGWKVKVFHTPGHTPGSCCYLIGKDYLVTGDNLAYHDGKFEHFISVFNMNTPEQEASIKKLPPLDSIKYILTAHYGVIRH